MSEVKFIKLPAYGEHAGDHQGYCLGSRCVWGDSITEAAEAAKKMEGER